MPGPRDYSAGTRAALQTLSRGTCYFPRCREPVLKTVEGEYSINYIVAHIYAAHANGPRYDETMTDDDRRAFSNLLLLCRGHSDFVDRKHVDDYSPETLLSWKADREAAGQDALAGLTGLTEDGLREILIESFEARHEEIMDTLARLEENDVEAFRLMRELLDEVEQLRAYGSLIDPDSADMLYTASRDLTTLPDSAEILLDAARDLRNLPDHAEILSAAASDLNNVQEHAAALNSAASKLRNLPDQIDMLDSLVTRLERLQGGWEY